MNEISQAIDEAAQEFSNDDTDAYITDFVTNVKKATNGVTIRDLIGKTLPTNRNVFGRGVTNVRALKFFRSLKIPEIQTHVEKLHENKVSQFNKDQLQRFSRCWEEIKGDNLFLLEQLKTHVLGCSFDPDKNCKKKQRIGDCNETHVLSEQEDNNGQLIKKACIAHNQNSVNESIQVLVPTVPSTANTHDINVVVDVVPTDSAFIQTPPTAFKLSNIDMLQEAMLIGNNLRENGDYMETEVKDRLRAKFNALLREVSKPK